MVVVMAGRSVDAEEAGNVDWNAVESWGSNSSAGSAFSEIPAGMLVVAGLIILTSLWITHLRPYAWFLAALIYLSYGIARVVGFGIDGMPHASIVSAAVIEIILGMISLAMLKGAARSAKNENNAEATAIS